MAHHRIRSLRFAEETKSSSPRIKHHRTKNGTIKQDPASEVNQHVTDSIGRINERVAEARLSKNPQGYRSLTDSTGSIISDPVFFSYPTAKRIQSTSSSSSSSSSSFRYSVGISALPSSSATNRKGPGKSDSDGGKITEKKKKKEKGAWFTCMRQESCKNSRRSPERLRVDEALIIEKAIVVENLPQFWADKYQPDSLNAFVCHKQEAQLLKELVRCDEFPHTLLKGPSGSGKRALAMAILREMYGEEWKLSHNIRHFPSQEGMSMKVGVPITFSCHHVELNVNLERNAKHALIGLVKEMSRIYAITPQDPNLNIKSDCQVMVLYEVDKAERDILQIIQWIIDCHSQTCKLILCCQDDAHIPESLRNLFKVVEVHPPTTSQIMEVLFEIAEKEDIHLSKIFCAMIAAKSNQNLRQAIMALEACKAFKYPFFEEQPISVGWEDVVIEIASIIVGPSNSCLDFVREKFQNLMEDFVHPKLILRKLVEELLKNIEAGLKRELYYWHAYYDKRLPPGSIALTKLVDMQFPAEFVAKFMSIYRKSFVDREYV